MKLNLIALLPLCYPAVVAGTVRRNVGQDQKSVDSQVSQSSDNSRARNLPEWAKRTTNHLRTDENGDLVVVKRQVPVPSHTSAWIPEPSRDGLGGPETEGADIEEERQNPDAVAPPLTDAGTVPNLKWPMALSNSLLFPGGWLREQLVTDLPPSEDFAGAQVHLEKGAIRQMHWHNTDEWAYVFNGSFLGSYLDYKGRNQQFKAEPGDFWYFPKGNPHAFQGLEDSNELLLVFDDGAFSDVGVTFELDNWIRHTPPEVIAKNFGLPLNNTEFKNIPNPFGTLNKGTVSNSSEVHPYGNLEGTAQSPYFAGSKMNATVAPGGGGVYKIVDTSVFPLSKNIVAQINFLKPRALRELHWHPNVTEWLYFQTGHARATCWLGSSNARTFDFHPGDTGVFPANTGHYIENMSDTEELIFLEVFHADTVEEVTLQQFLALTTPDIVAQVLNVTEDVVKTFKTEKQVLV
ncbi:Bicupin, oxalate decarboxylase/oxidase, partial [Xylogone sp. PMI_703]